MIKVLTENVQYQPRLVSGKIFILPTFPTVALTSKLEPLIKRNEHVVNYYYFSAYKRPSDSWFRWTGLEVTSLRQVLLSAVHFERVTAVLSPLFSHFITFLLTFLPRINS